MQQLRRLTPAQVRELDECGYCFPVEAISRAEAEAAGRELDRFLERSPWPHDMGLRHKPYLYLKWLNDLVRHPALLDLAEEVLGPNLLVWRASLFVKLAKSEAIEAWHQDALYWGLQGEDLLSVWVPFCDVSAESGAVRFVPGSHRGPLVPHRYELRGANATFRGQAIAGDIPEDRAVTAEMRAGEVALFRSRTIHGSPPNRTDRIRGAVGIRYIAPTVSQPGRIRTSASLVRGTDPYRHFDPEPVPRYDYDPVAVAAHRRSLRHHALRFAVESLQRPTRQQLAAIARILARNRPLHSIQSYFSRKPA